MSGSVQQSRYLKERAKGRAITEACFWSGIKGPEATFIEGAIKRGELILPIIPEIPAAGIAAPPEEGRSMAKTVRPGDKGDQPQVTNLTSTKKVLAECAAGFRRIDKERSDLNEDAADLRERCRNQGIDPKWLLTAIRVADMEVEDRSKADESYAIAREALGMGLQRSLFETIGGEGPDAEEKQPTRVSDGGKAAGKAKARKGAPAPAPTPDDNSDLAGENDWLVVDHRAQDEDGPIYLGADQKDWVSSKTEAGRWGEDRARQIAAEHDAEAEAFAGDVVPAE